MTAYDPETSRYRVWTTFGTYLYFFTEAEAVEFESTIEELYAKRPSTYGKDLDEV